MAVNLKGWRSGLLVQFSEETIWDDLRTALEAKLNEAEMRSFWRGAQTTLELGEVPVTEAQLLELLDYLRAQFELNPIAVIAANPDTRAVAERLHLVAYSELPQPIRMVPAPAAQVDASGTNGSANKPASDVPPVVSGSNALYIPGTVRSGQRIVHSGHVVVAGDINAGAEVMAAGDVLVFGTLRGLAHAGCQGDQSARIIAGVLKPQQIRIASFIARAPEQAEEKQRKSGDLSGGPRRPAEVARIENGEIQIFPV